MYTIWNHSVICKIFYLFVLFKIKNKNKDYIRKGDNFDQFHMNVNRKGTNYCFN
jgi:hypothetical protein